MGSYQEEMMTIIESINVLHNHNLPKSNEDLKYSKNDQSYQLTIDTEYMALIDEVTNEMHKRAKNFSDFLI